MHVAQRTKKIYKNELFISEQKRKKKSNFKSSIYQLSFCSYI